MSGPPGGAGLSSADRRLGQSVADLDAAGFVGRADTLRDIDAMLDGTDGRQILFVHGPGGSGKSALLRAVRRRAQARGRSVQLVDGRLLDVSKEALVSACRPADAPGWVILIDSFEQIHALAPVLRAEVLPQLNAETVVVIAGRRPPGAFWFRDGWEHVAHDLALRPLRDDEADELLAQSAIGGSEAAHLRRWAKGSPLALRVAAAAHSGHGGTDEGDLSATIVSRLVGEDFDEADAELVALASVARAIDERLIADVLPDREPSTSFRSFRELSLTEPYGNRLALHDVVRDALRVDLQRRDPDTFRRLVCRTADHLHQRVRAGEFGLLGEMAELLMDPFLRTAYSAGRGTEFRADQIEPGDADRLADQLGAAGSSRWANATRLFRDAPELVTVVRGAAGEPVGFGIATAAHAAPEGASGDPILGPLIDFARVQFPDAVVPIWRDCVNLLADDHPARADVFALLNHPAHMSMDLARSRAVIGAIELTDASGWALRTSVGAERIPGLDFTDGERTVAGYVIDNGPGLLAGNVRDQIYLGQRLSPPARDTAPPDQVSSIAESLRSALTHFHDPIVLADNPLAEGAGVSARAGSVQELVRSSLDAAYGPSSARNPMRRAIERGYLDPSGGHERAMADLHVARSTYFRMLKKARDQLAAAVALRPRSGR